MKDVTVPREKLLDIVKRNREHHRAAYLEAFEGYSTAMRKALEDNLAAFKANSRHRVVITEYPPEDHTGDYDVVLQMIEMEVNGTVKLDQASFRQYVRDEWGWKQQWSVSNAKYMPSRPE